MDQATRNLLEDCATQFQYYADIHASKNSFEGNKKVIENLRWRDRIRKHLDGTP